jgi:hypothetical protein
MLVHQLPGEMCRLVEVHGEIHRRDISPFGPCACPRLPVCSRKNITSPSSADRSDSYHPR